MIIEPRDAPYPELKKSHTMSRTGRPFTDVKPPPAAPVWAAIEGLARYHVLLAAIELRVFDAVLDAEWAESGELAERLGVSPPHLTSLLDGVVALGLLDKVSGRYAANDTTRRYLVSDGPACMAQLVPVAPGPQHNWTRLADTVRRGRPATPIDDDPGAFYVPLVEGTFTTMWRTATRLDRIVRYATSAASPRVLDLGAGGAPWAIAVLTACPDGHAVVNDLHGVLDVARRTTAEHGVADRCEFRSGDYFEIEIESGEYDLVVLGHVCRAEGADGAVRLIRRAADALRPGGRVIVADYFQDPERKLNPHAVLMGVTMMANTVNGFTFTTEQYGGWLADAGFVDVRLVEPIAFQQCMIATRKGDLP
ncbi:MAG TPA: class I SAM-dependent methyltransferase [Ilumatobacter sp.]|nr:class I SAM-dependent methyltransferase [Ilumatobacter sp.]